MAEGPAFEQIRATLTPIKNAPILIPAEDRAKFEARYARADLWPGTQLEETTAGSVPLLWVQAAEAGPVSQGVVLYLHGGAYRVGSPRAYRALTSWLSAAGRVPVLGVDYRLAPENPFPAALDDAVAAYRWLLQQGVSPEKIVIGGDSAGGGLSVATLLALREAGDPLPAGAFLISPWTDLTCSSRSFTEFAERDPMVGTERLRQCALDYAGNHDPRNPLISPLYADLSGLPPILIQVGTEEILFDDAVQLAEQIFAVRGQAEVTVWEGMWHVWHAFAPLVLQSRQAIEEIGHFLRWALFDEPMPIADEEIQPVEEDLAG